MLTSSKRESDGLDGYSEEDGLFCGACGRPCGVNRYPDGFGHEFGNRVYMVTESDCHGARVFKDPELTREYEGEEE